MPQTLASVFRSTLRPDLKICWIAVPRVCFFEYTRPVGKNFFYHFEMEKIGLILIYNIFVTKKIFFGNEHQKMFLTRTFLVGPVGWRQINIFLSLALLVNYDRLIWFRGKVTSLHFFLILFSPKHLKFKLSAIPE